MLTATLAELMGEVDNLLAKDPVKPAERGYGINEDDEYARDGKHYYKRAELVDMVFRCQDLLLQIKDAYARERPAAVPEASESSPQ